MLHCSTDMKCKTKSPLKDKPLRYVAQSTDEIIEELVFDKLLVYYSAVALMFVVVGFEWLRYFKPYEKPPIFISITSQ